MAHPYLALEGVSYALPDGTTLFSDLNEIFDQRPTGLVGRNGVGKTVLARLLAGQLQASAGRCVRSGRVHYLAQQTAPPAGATVADLAGVQPVLTALQRIEAGSTAPADFDAVGERWDIRQQLSQALQSDGLSHLSADTRVSQLSGGESMRVALLGAILSGADFLILDEPSNHLDATSRSALSECLAQWPRGLLVVSHDRRLLDGMARTVELSSVGLRSYGGNHAFYAHARAQEQAQAQAELQRLKQQRQRDEKTMRDQRERQEKRQASGARHRKEANQAKVLLDRQKERSDHSAGKLQRQHTAARAELAQRMRDAAQQVAPDMVIQLHGSEVESASQRQIAMLGDVALPYVAPPWQQVNLQLRGQQRLALRGPNGCGKSTLLKVLAGQLRPLAGMCAVRDGAVHLDQRMGDLPADRSALAQLQTANPRLSESELRTRLAHLGLDARKALLPTGALSGGERMKAAMACVLYAEPPPPLLLLDEPSNHLDLPSLQALEAMLTAYTGALVVASHDEAFLNALRLTDQLVACADGWRLSPWLDGAKGSGAECFK